jgi:multiple sugar transport system substrate-binding protein
VLRALDWEHPRCRAPMTACAEVWNAEHPDAPVAWSFRSLTAFGDEPIEEAARGFDLVVIDHPFVGRAADTGSLVPLDELVSNGTLDELAADAVGPSHDSYAFAGRQWGLATDAACQLSALRPGIDPPQTWDEAVALARATRSALPLSPPHAISSFLTLSAGRALDDRESAERAWQTLSALYAAGPREALESEPPEVLARLAAGELDYVPVTYGYVTYADRCRFAPVPGVRGGVLGGAGLAVSRASEQPERAAEFAVWASGSDAQRTIVARAGGQPGSRSAWLDADVDRDANGFYSATLAAHEQAWVRPREAWWPAFQLAAGRLLVDALADRRNPVAELGDLYRRSRP